MNVALALVVVALIALGLIAALSVMRRARDAEAAAKHRRLLAEIEALMRESDVTP